MAVPRPAWLAAVGAVVVLAVAVGSAAPAETGTTPAEYRALVSAARQTLAARAIALVDGANPSPQTPLAAGNVVRSAQFAATEAAALRSLAARRDRLRASGEVYLAAQTEVRVTDVARSGDRLRLTLAELTTLHRRVRGDEPGYTAFEATRVFDFVLDGGRWALTGEALVGGGGPAPLTEPDAVSDGSNLPLIPMGGVARVA